MVSVITSENHVNANIVEQLASPLTDEGQGLPQERHPLILVSLVFRIVF